MKFSVKAGLALAVSAAFVATSVAPAFAASQVDFSGFYQAKFHTFGNHDWNAGGNDTKRSDSWFRNRFRLNMDVQATDEVSVHARWQGPNDEKWGQKDNGGNVQVKYAYGQVKQDWGTIQVGRLNDQDGIGHAGLKTMGWDPTSVDGDEENYRPFDTGDGADGVNYFNTWDNGFSFELAYLKPKTDGASRFDDDGFTNIGSDKDWDRFQAEGRYSWDTGAASLAVAYDRDATGWNPEIQADPTATPPVKYKAERPYSTVSAWYINPAFMQSWGAFSTHAEAMFGFGKYNNFTKTADKDGKISGQGFYIDFDYNYGPGRVNLAGWWTSGNKWSDKGKQKALPDGMGKGFNPLLVLYDGGALDAVNDGYEKIGKFGNYGLSRANHWAIDLNGQHAFTDEITVRYALAYAALTNAGKQVHDDNGNLIDQKKDIGWEADLGATINILDNLDFYTGFGYLFAGDAFKDGKNDADDGYAWINTLYFNF